MLWWLGMIIFRISPVDDERHPIDPLPSSTNASATQPEPATGTISFSLFWSQDIQRTLSTRRTACDVRPQKTSHETRFVLGDPSRKPFKKKVFCLVGAPGLEPGTR